MNFNATGGAFAVIAVLFGLITTVIWFVVGWRAMRAHERLADAAELAVRVGRDAGA